jgi:hypothetical protein
MFTLEWSTSSRLKDVMHQFQKHLDYLQEFWSVLDNIDKSLCVVDVKQPARASAIRRIDAGLIPLPQFHLSPYSFISVLTKFTFIYLYLVHFFLRE